MADCNAIKNATLGAGTIFRVSYDCGETFEEVEGMTGVGVIGEMSESVETTSIKDRTRTYIPSIKTPASKTFTGNHRPEIAAQAKFIAAADANQSVIIQIDLPTNPITRATAGYALLGHQINEPTPDGAITFTINAQGSGPTKKEYIPVIAVTGITVSPTTLTGAPGATGELTFTITPATATNKKIQLFSEDPASVGISAHPTDPLKAIVTYVRDTTTPVNVSATTEDGFFKAVAAVTVDTP
ncbi:major tail tube protein [Serratia phage vB_SmaS_PhooPhighters]|uniref:Putative major tail protein n=1 Tax=Serratia phage vB_SmaS_Rovert TaxID=2777363 RepID=A0A7T3TKV4_9CAUD|nr:putative major tail protein [Serratia phage vB_SmaS_Rovert]QPX74978.1 putative major tail protein [Serratia phage vB_SmaS_Rovert]UGO51951.1 major tail tube protein [Serratia phage vB_SmaS_PhooPhighters]